MDRHFRSMRKGLAVALSVLSCGSIAGAAKIKNGQRSFGAKVTYNPGKGKKKPFRTTPKVNPKVPGKNQSKVDAASEKTFGGELSKMAGNAKSAWNTLSTTQKTVLAIGGLEALSVLYNGRGAVENVLGTILGPSLRRLGAIIFSNTGTVDSEFGTHFDQDKAETAVVKQHGLFFGIIDKIAFYLKDSYVDFVRAFYHGCKGDSLYMDITENTAMREVGKDDIANNGFFDFRTWGAKSNFGPAQAKLFVRAMQMPWKRSPLNVWAYRFGKKLFSTKGNLSNSDDTSQISSGENQADVNNQSLFQPVFSPNGPIVQGPPIIGLDQMNNNTTDPNRTEIQIPGVPGVPAQGGQGQ